MYSLEGGVFILILFLVYYYFGKKKTINPLAIVGYKMTIIIWHYAESMHLIGYLSSHIQQTLME